MQVNTQAAPSRHYRGGSSRQHTYPFIGWRRWCYSHDRGATYVCIYTKSPRDGEHGGKPVLLWVNLMNPPLIHELFIVGSFPTMERQHPEMPQHQYRSSNNNPVPIHAYQRKHISLLPCINWCTDISILIQRPYLNQNGYELVLGGH